MAKKIDVKYKATNAKARVIVVPPVVLDPTTMTLISFS